MFNMGYKDHKEQLKKGAELLVDAHYSRLDASIFAENPITVFEEKKTAVQKEAEAYIILKSGSVEGFGQ